MKGLLLLIVCFTLLSLASQPCLGQRSFTAIGVPVTENFDGMSNITGVTHAITNNVTPIEGLYSNKATYRVNHGNETTGSVYSNGASGATERAFGSLASGSTDTILNGMRFKNLTGVTITSLQVTYVGEQWRKGATNASPNSLTFDYRQAPTIDDLTNGSYLSVTDLNFTSPTFDASAGVGLNGNLAAHRTARSATLSVTILPGEEIMLRWTDIDDAGSDHGLAIDDLSVTPGAPPDTTITEGPSGTVNVPTATFVFSSSEPGSTYECSLDGAAFTDCSPGIEYAALTNGNHYFQVRAIDEEGNPDGSPASRTWTVRAGDGKVTFEVDRLDDSPSADECLDAVPDDCSLRRAIGTSNPGDTITFDPGIYTAPGLAPKGTTLGVIELDGTEIPISNDITITGPGASQLTIDAGGLSRIFNIATGAAVDMSGMTLANGNAGAGQGGAIFQNLSSSLSLDEMVITDNAAAAGGGISTSQATLDISNSTFSNNEAATGGGGIRNAESNVTITNSLIDGNAALGGGGVYSNTQSAGSITITGSIISDNCSGTISGSDCTAGSVGGGIMAFGVTITNSRISGNKATDGGGIYHERGLTLTNSTISDNTASVNGGGTFGDLNQGLPSLTVAGSTFVGNTAGTAGGGVYHQAADPSSIRNSTFSANSAPTGGSLWIFTSGVTSVSSSTFSGGTVHNESFGGGFQLPVSNSIFAASCTGTDIVDGGFNLDRTNGCGFTAGTSQTGTDPRLAPLANNGGPTQTHRPYNSSPAIDRGNSLEPFDQRGFARIVNFPNLPNTGNGSDIGAFEAVAPTAADVSISGSVSTVGGLPIGNATVTLSGGDLVAPVVVSTGSFGTFAFGGLRIGQTYVITVFAGRHSFAEPVRVVVPVDNIDDIHFIAN